ncbi:hypothetical protein LR48_Vigan03g207800 [Vigna angularis]|uniref:4-alpha-glucanotransferase n=1 Tax=Phaseolus angularis TaxID=3914 RepID=A0A0L9U7F8_PHAAN|nr:hypothetical protein LR48_Vigan03g207800 [Vigna angularis]
MVNPGLFSGNKSVNSVKVSFRIPYFTQWGQSLLVCGSVPVLGAWNVKRGVLLSVVHQGSELIWGGSITVPRGFQCQYSYYVVDDKKNVLRCEMGKKRELILPEGVQSGQEVEFRDLWQETPWRGAGVAIPMFSVRSESDLGVGEFLDLKLLVDWAVASGFHLVQLLPINDTSVHGMWWDSYPYSSLSVFALHPLYLRVQALSKNIPEEIKKEIEKAKQQLDQKDVDYEATMATKLSIAKKVFAQEKDLILNSSSFQQFFCENEGWLKPYAAFCFLRDFFETSDRSQWGRFAHYSDDKLSEAALYARKKGVILKGDLPIGVDKNSVDTWVYPNLFRMNTSTGAPPDYFDKNGQNWGFPTYNWEEMSKDNYGWWRGRLTQMAKYFTAYRIDHILGFFRIWELPDHAMTGLVGKFRPSIPLSQEELEREGIWDFNRLSRPYIKRELLEEKFGAAWTFVATTFLNEFDKNIYEVIILFCIVFCIVFIDFCLIINFHIAHAFRFDRIIT